MEGGTLETTEWGPEATLYYQGGYYRNRARRMGGGSGGRRASRCGHCAGCTRKSCGECKACKNMPRFGGPGTFKQCCERRKCEAPRVREVVGGEGGPLLLTMREGAGGEGAGGGGWGEGLGWAEGLGWLGSAQGACHLMFHRSWA